MSTKKQIIAHLFAAAPEPICADCLAIEPVTRTTAYACPLTIQPSGFEGLIDPGEDRCVSCNEHKNRVKATL